MGEREQGVSWAMGCNFWCALGEPAFGGSAQETRLTRVVNNMCLGVRRIQPSILSGGALQI